MKAIISDTRGDPEALRAVLADFRPKGTAACFPRRPSRGTVSSHCLLLLAVCAVLAGRGASARAQATSDITVLTARTRQVFNGLGSGAIFFEGHITSLAVCHKDVRQQQLYDDMFSRVPTKFLQLMIRETHEPRNDNDDPYVPAFA